MSDITQAEKSKQIAIAYQLHQEQMARERGDVPHVAPYPGGAMWYNSKEKAQKVEPIAIGTRVIWDKFFGEVKTGTVVVSGESGRAGSVMVQFDQGGLLRCRIAALQKISA